MSGLNHPKSREVTMRFIVVVLLGLAVTGCASVRNRPPEPGNNYWQINKQVPAQPAQPTQPQDQGGNNNGR